MSKGPGRRRGIFPRFGIAEDVDREIRSHLELRAAELEADGWNPEEAPTEAQRLFGNTDDVAHRCREITRSHRRAERRAKSMEMFWQDVRYGVRTLTRDPVFTLVAVFTLALGIGANTAIFSVVSGVLLRDLPYENPQELVWVREINNRGGTMAAAAPNFVDWHQESTSFSGLAAYGTTSTTILGADSPVRIGFAAVTGDFWKVFPVRPTAGRLFPEAGFGENQTPLLVISQSFWEREMGGAPWEGRSLEVNGVRAPIVGVTPEGFEYPAGAEVWGTWAFWGNSDSRTSHFLNVVGRLAAGVTVERARQEMDALTKRIVLREPDADPDYLATGAQVIDLHERVAGGARSPLLFLFGAAGFVLLVACTNLASTLLARGAGRTRELAVRASLGASRGRLVRQLLTESLLLAGLGAAAGSGLAVLIMRGLQLLNPSSLPRLAEIEVDGPVLLFTGAVALLTALLFGLFPARRMAGEGMGAALKEGSRGNAPDRGTGIWPLLVGTEVALSIILLMGAGLLVQSFKALMGEEVGFDASDTGALSVSLSQLKYETAADQALWFHQFETGLEAHPEIASAGVISAIPLAGGLPTGRMELDGDLNKRASGGYVVTSAGAFEALDIPLIRGRLFDERDGPGHPHVAIVNQAWADRFWPGEDPIGKSVSGGGMDDLYYERPFSEVVGLVGNVRFEELGVAGGPVAFFPYRQRPFRVQYGTSLVVESSTGDAAALTSPLRRLLQQSDPDVPFRYRTIDEVQGASLAERRFILLILGGFSLTALILAGVGIYGVISHTVARRTREMGIRLALGASPSTVMKGVMAAAMRMVAAGLVAGMVGALVLSRTVESLLYGVGPRDPLTLAAVLAVLTGVAALASWVPARAGTRVDPMETIRAE